LEAGSRILPKQDAKETKRGGGGNCIGSHVTSPTARQVERWHLSTREWRLWHERNMKGGPARAAKMTLEEQSEAARKAAKVRWNKKRREEESS
jgi:hypothetical protein